MATHSSFLPGESQGQGSLVGCRLWGCAELDTTDATQQHIQLLFVSFSAVTHYHRLSGFQHKYKLLIFQIGRSEGLKQFSRAKIKVLLQSSSSVCSLYNGSMNSRGEGWGKETLIGEAADQEDGRLAPQNNRPIGFWLLVSFIDQRWGKVRKQSKKTINLENI